MYLDTGRLVVSPSDLTAFLACGHSTQLDLQVAGGGLTRPASADAALEVVTQRGIAHERVHLESLHAAALDVVEIDLDACGGDLGEAERRTVEAMVAGADVVYQATFFDGRWRGHADFLLKRADRSSDFGAWAYDVADTKLARRLKVPALLQMASYAGHLRRLQGVDPELLVVVKGDGAQEAFRYADCAAYFRRVCAAFSTALEASPLPTYPDPVTHCTVCRWREVCDGRRRVDDHLSLVAWMGADHARALQVAGITTVEALADAPVEALPTTINLVPRVRLHSQARLQVSERRARQACFELLPQEPGRGLLLLPEPSPGDLFFDMEGDPFAEGGGLEYLFGVHDMTGGFTPYWADEHAAERVAYETVVDRFIAAWDTDPCMHVYHYAPYEPTRIKSLMGRYGSREQEVDRLLRGQRFVDLYAVVRQGLRVSRESYSIKELEAFYLPNGREGSEIKDAAASIVAYEEWLQSGDPSLRDEIERYNRLDCESTRLLRDWLEARRSELATRDGPLVRPVHGDGSAPDSVAVAASAVEALSNALQARAPDPATRLLAELLDWHRREARPGWWEYYARLAMTDEELVEDSAALGLLEVPTQVGTVKRSTVWQHRFPPQDTKLGPGESQWIDPRTDASPGEVVSIDPVDGCLELKRATSSLKPHPTSIAPGPPIDERHQRDALMEMGAWVRDNAIDAPGKYEAARSLLRRTPPTADLRRADESASDAARRVALGLRSGVLAVQGPPGTGKTFTGAHTVVDLVRTGKKVGICAVSHKAIGNMLIAVARAARERGEQLDIVQKADDQQACIDPDVDCVADNAGVAARLGGLDVLGGTPWLFARPDLRAAVDVLVVDEAGQMSLANVCAVSVAANSLILLGDPQQLAQPAQGVHPPNAAASALEHLIHGRSTMPGDLGLLLDETWRMHPDVCGFVSDTFYDGLLHAHPSCAAQATYAPGALSGTGLRWLPVAHSANRSASTEEAEVVAALVVDLLRGEWTDQHGSTRAMSLDDVLIVSPYNAHVHRLRSLLPSGSRIGTVDKFQGQEAPVVVYSMATSSSEDAPRALEFLYSLNRLNVALSRARCLAAVVASPRLLDAQVRTPEQLRMVNALCSYAERAAPAA